VGRYRAVPFVRIFWSFLTPILLLTVYISCLVKYFQGALGVIECKAAQLELRPVALFAGFVVFTFFSPRVHWARTATKLFVIANATSQEGRLSAGGS